LEEYFVNYLIIMRSTYPNS